MASIARRIEDERPVGGHRRLMRQGLELVVAALTELENDRHRVGGAQKETAAELLGEARSFLLIVERDGRPLTVMTHNIEPGSMLHRIDRTVSGMATGE
ncbi:MAG TPA: hypothetical protein ENI87_05415 [bacterium]|nr:hypothetical protein [bacterium]